MLKYVKQIIVLPPSAGKNYLYIAGFINIIWSRFKHWKSLCELVTIWKTFVIFDCVRDCMVSWWWCNIPWHMLESGSGLAEDGQPIPLQHIGEECRRGSKTNCWVFWFNGKTGCGSRSYCWDVEVSWVCHCLHWCVFLLFVLLPLNSFLIT